MRLIPCLAKLSPFILQMNLITFSCNSSTAAENMRLDAALLAFSAQTGQAACRCYEWNEQAFTFGYSQSWESVKAATGNPSARHIRRITGGGIVDHCNDLTYAVACPPGHPVYREDAQMVYAGLHNAIAMILASAGISAELAPCPAQSCAEANSGLAQACFTRAEPFDVQEKGTGKKLAGAAMKRHRQGLLIQGSVALEDALLRSSIQQQLPLAIARWLCATLQDQPLENLKCFDLAAAPDFASDAWNRKR
jgi:lipoate-protein ligase A